MKVSAPLTAADLEMFAKIGVDASVLAHARVCRVTHDDARALCGIQYRSDHLEGIAFPYYDPATDTVQTWRVRRDHPEVDTDGSAIAKYVSPPDRRHLYFPPGCAADLADASVPAILVEAEKSALAVRQANDALKRGGVLPIALGGCWGWRGVIGKATASDGTRVDEKGPLPDFDKVQWSGRDTILVFDSNVASNAQVQAARWALAAELASRGAKVRVAELPLEPGINGPDDLLGRRGPAVFFGLIDQAKAAKTKTPKTKPDKPKAGRALVLEDPPAWPAPVDGATLLDAIAQLFTRYLALPDQADVALALWVVHTYASAVWFTSPLLAITSPSKRCGKTLTLIVVGALVPRRLFASNISSSAVFRTIERYRPTLLIDEGDTFMRENEELRGVLNSGHTRTTAVVVRTVGDDHESRIFSTWCPKAVALIGKLAGTLEDRSIEVKMRRRAAGERVERLRQDRIEAECADLRSQAVRWIADLAAGLRARDPDVPALLHDRAADNWRPLLALADAAGGTWPARARKAATALSGIADDDVGPLLLGDIKAIFEEHDTEDQPCSILGSTAIVEALIALDDRPWAEWSKGRPLSTAKLARLLKGYDIIGTGTVRIGDKTVHAYRRVAFADAWDRYLDRPTAAESTADAEKGPSHGSEAQQRNSPNESGPEREVSKSNTAAECFALKSEKSSMNTEGSCAVALRKGDRPVDGRF